MRFIAVMLILFAAGKVGYQQYLYRAATGDVMVATFKEQAVAACQRDASATGLADRTAWAKPSQVWFGVGNPSADVSVWQVDHARWGERYRTPYIFVATASAGGGPVCAYDIGARRTMVLPLGHS
jgi:hypothetical protein